MSMFTGYGELSLSIVISVVTLPESVCFITHDSLLEFKSNALVDSDGDLPLDIWHFLRDSLNLYLTSPDQLDTMPCPLIMKGLLLEMSFPSEVILSIERIFVH